MKVASLGSGSEGNAAVVQSGAGAALLVDCGFSARECLGRLSNLGLSGGDIAAILVTHEHSDHLRGASVLARRLGVPIYTSWGTWRARLAGELDESHFREVVPDTSFSVAGVGVESVTVPHDARQPCQFVFTEQGRRVGILSDLGHITPRVQACYDQCDLLMLECNHDLEMLADGPYPASLKRRVGGNLGHLNNAQAAAFLQQLEQVAQQVVVGHISQKNNHPELVLSALLATERVGYEQITLATQRDGFDWLTVG